MNTSSYQSSTSSWLTRMLRGGLVVGLLLVSGAVMANTVNTYLWGPSTDDDGAFELSWSYNPTNNLTGNLAIVHTSYIQYRFNGTGDWQTIHYMTGSPVPTAGTFPVNGIGPGTHNFRGAVIGYDYYQGYTVGGFSSAINVVVTPPVEFAVNNTSVAEGGNLVFTVTKSGSSTGNRTVNYATASGSAGSGDYTAKSGTLTFTASQTSKTVTVPSVEDSTYESSESLYLNLSSPSAGGVISDGQSIGTITNDDGAPSFAVNNVSVSEGGNLTFTVTKSGATSKAHNINYATANSSAGSGDYTAKSGTLSFTSGQASKTVTVPSVEDSLYESSETVKLNLSAATNGATIADSQGIGTITNDDGAPSFAVNNVSVSEGGNLTFTVTKSGSTSKTHNINYATANSSAGSGDYTTKSGTLSFTAGQTSQTVTVVTTEDVVYESSETVKLNLSSATSGATIADSQGIGTISNDDTAPSFSINATQSAEGSPLTFTVTKHGATQLSHTVAFETGDGSALKDSDYTAKDGTLTFAASDPSESFTVTTLQDTSYERPETFTATLSAPSNNATLTSGQASAAGTIIDDDSSPTFHIIGGTVTEGGTMTVNVQCNGETSVAPSVDYRVKTGSAGSADYTTTAGTLEFGNGNNLLSFTVDTTDDDVYEGSEAFTVEIHNPQDAEIDASDESAQVTIIDNDPAPSFSISSASIEEGGELVFVVTKQGTTVLSHAVNYATAAGTGINPASATDYIGRIGTLTFAAGDTEQEVRVTTTEDGTIEEDEVVQLILSAATSGALIASGSAEGTINNDDYPPPAFTISNAATGEEGTARVFTITKSGYTNLDYSVNYQSVDGTAKAGQDYTEQSGTLTFTESDTSLQVSVTTLDDTLAENGEQFVLKLLSPTGGATVTIASASATLTDNDGIVDLATIAAHIESTPSNTSADVLETDSVGTTAGSFRVDESGSATYSIPIATAAGTAGVAPQLSLNYSSQGGNGLMGLGWNIGGLSGISRSRQTLQQDGQAAPITWGAEDRFALDGQRLILVSGTYGDPNSEYRTEIDSFAKIFARGGTSGAGNPDYWEVQRKDGSTSYYGDVPAGAYTDARQSNSAGQVLTWGLKRFDDSVGNPIWFEYEATGGHSIKEVRYAYGSADGPGGYNARVVFNYDSSRRTDEISGYVMGHEFTTSKRLASVDTYNTVSSGEKLLRHYGLSYLDEGNGSQTQPTTDDLSRLDSLKECSDITEQQCLPATDFDWSLPTLGIGGVSSSFSFGVGHDDYVADYRPADINGDGRLDLVWLEASTNRHNNIDRHGLYYTLATTSGGYGSRILAYEDFEFAGSAGGDGGYKIEILDYNADGRMDVLLWDNNDHQSGKDSEWRVHLSTPQGNGSWRLSGSGIAVGLPADKDLVLADINSDGLVDVVSVSAVASGTSVVIGHGLTGLPLAGPVFTNKIQAQLLEVDSSQPATSPRYYHFGAVQDIATLPVYTPPALFPGQTSDPQVLYTEEFKKTVKAVDVNGDGRVDIAVEYERHVASPTHPDCVYAALDGYYHANCLESNKSTMLLTSSANGFEVADDFWVYAYDFWPGTQFVDINADGVTDVVRYTGGGWSYELGQGNGVDFEAGVQMVAEPTENGASGISTDDRKKNLSAQQLQMVDYNRDGYLDVVWFDYEANYLKVRYWNGDDFDAAANIKYIFGRDEDQKKLALRFFDVNADAAPDLVQFDLKYGTTSTMKTSLSSQQGAPTNRITQITNGLGAETDIIYGTLATSGHYQRVNVGTTTSGSMWAPQPPPTPVRVLIMARITPPCRAHRGYVAIPIPVPIPVTSMRCSMASGT